MVDNRAVAVAQRQAQEAIDASPRQVAQRQQAEALAPRKNMTGLPDNLKAGVENLSGYSLDDVQVHYNSAKPAQLQAHAYAQGTDIHVAPGQEKHLPHEAWHVVQQKQGRVKTTIQMKGGVNVNDDAGLEKEADGIGGDALAFVSNADGNISEETLKKKGPTQKLIQKMSKPIFGGFNGMDAINDESESDDESDAEIDWAGFSADELLDDLFVQNHFAADLDEANQINLRRAVPVCTVINAANKDAFAEEIRQRNELNYFLDNNQGNIHDSEIELSGWEFTDGNAQPVIFFGRITYAVRSVRMMDSNYTAVSVYSVSHLEGRV